MRVLVFGASSTQGLWDTEGGWVARLRRNYDTQVVKNIREEANYPDVFNLGVQGDMIGNLLKRFENETEARLWQNEELAFIFSIGTNDTAIGGNGKTWSTSDSYRDDIKKLTKMAKDYSNKIIFVGLPCCDESRTTPVFWADVHYTNTRMLEVNKELHSFCNEEKIIYVPIYEILKERLDAGQDVFADGLHPNNEGHELIFQAVKPELDKLLAV